MPPPLVSWMTPTLGRPELHERLYDDFCQDGYPEKELVVYDESRAPSPFFGRIRDPRVRYVHAPAPPRIGGVTRIGAARNRMLALARGAILAHRDDDDHYDPDYLATMIERLGRAALCKLDVWRCLHEPTGTLFEWDTRTTGGKHFALQSTQVKEVEIDPEEMGPDLGPGLLEAFRIGFGWSYVYPRTTAERYPFPAEGTEDIPWVQALRAAGEAIVFVSDAAHLALHAVHVDPQHPTGGSAHFPQRMLGAAGAPRLYEGVRRRMIGAMGNLQELPEGKAIRLEPGKRYSVLASVRRKHSIRALTVRAGAWGAEIEMARDEVPPEEYGVSPAKKDYRLVHIVGVSRQAVTMPWRTPSFLRILGEESAVVKAWVEPGGAVDGADLVAAGLPAPIGAGAAAPFGGGDEPLDPADGDIALAPGRTYAVSALVKDGHTGAALEAFLTRYGLRLAELVEKTGDRAGYRFVMMRLESGAGAGGMLPWRLPWPLSVIDDSHVIDCRVSRPVGAGQAETFDGVPEGHAIDRPIAFLREIPEGLAPRSLGAGRGTVWEGAGDRAVVQSRETGRMAVTRRVGAGYPIPGGLPPAPAAFTQLLQGQPTAASAWQGVQAQLLSENPLNATNGVLNAAQMNFAGSWTQLEQNLGAVDPTDLQSISNAASSLLLNGSTVKGAVQNVSGLIQGALSGNTSEIVQSFTGVLVSGIGLEVAAGSITLGVGAAVVAGIELFASLFQPGGLFAQNPPAAEVCGAKLSAVPSYVVGCAWTFGSPTQAGPGSPDWRRFPEPGNPADAWWFSPGETGAKWTSGATTDEWQCVPSGSVASKFRPIDCAFPQYHQLECDLALAAMVLNPAPPLFGGAAPVYTVNEIMLASFVHAYFGAWKANQEYALNGLAPQDDALVLGQVQKFWNDAHPVEGALTLTPRSPDPNAYKTDVTPYPAACTGTFGNENWYVTMLLGHAAQDYQKIPLVNGSMVLNVPYTDSGVIGPGFAGLGQTPTAFPPAPPPKPLSAGSKVAIGVVLAAGVAASAAVGAAVVQGLPWDHYVGLGWEGAKGGAASAWGSVAGLAGAGEAKRPKNPVRGRPRKRSPRRSIAPTRRSA